MFAKKEEQRLIWENMSVILANADACKKRLEPMEQKCQVIADESMPELLASMSSDRQKYHRNYKLKQRRKQIYIR